MKLSAVAALVGIVIVLVSQWEYPPPAYVSACPPRTPPEVTVRSVTDNGLDADFFYRAASKPQKAVILLGGSEGGKSWSDATDFIRELVDEGCCVLSLAYFGTEGLPRHLQGVPLAGDAEGHRRARRLRGGGGIPWSGCVTANSVSTMNTRLTTRATASGGSSPAGLRY